MSDYRTDEEQIEAIKKWWNENGKSIIAGIVIGLGAIFGWRTWDHHTKLQTEAASTLYQQMVEASQQDDAENTRVYADRILADYDSTSYAIFAALMLAKLSVNTNDLSTAETHLRWALKNNSQTEINHITTLRLVRILIATNEYDEALQLLDTENAGQFITQYEELRGDIFRKQDKDKAARQAYEKALANSEITDNAESILQMKLDELGKI